MSTTTEIFQMYHIFSINQYLKNAVVTDIDIVDVTMS